MFAQLLHFHKQNVLFVHVVVLVLNCNVEVDIVISV